MPPEAGSSVKIVRCEKHGLRYNAAAQDGCARCRRERSPASAGAAAAPASLQTQLLAALGLIVATGSLAFVAHQELIRSFRGFFSPSSFLEDSLEGESAEAEIDLALEWFDKPGMQQRMKEDPELRRMVERLEDPELRRELREEPDELQRYMERLDEQLLAGDDPYQDDDFYEEDDVYQTDDTYQEDEYQ